MPEPNFFASAAEFRLWLEKHHAEVQELWVGFHKRSTGKPSLTWPESVDCALCFGWIDGIRKSLGEASYTIRFTPRKPTSTWSAINISRVAELTRMGLMRPSGHKAFQQRREEKSATYSYERRTATLSATHEKEFRDNQPAWEYFQSQPPWYRRAAAHWVASAKKEETRRRRFAALLESSRQHRRIDALASKK